MVAWPRNGSLAPKRVVKCNKLTSQVADHVKGVQSSKPSMRMSPLKLSMGMFLVSPRLKRMKAIMSDMDGAREAFQMLAC